jgi:formylglycine-generating enzyme
MRTSSDNGCTWRTELIDPEHRYHNQVISGTSHTRQGFLIQPCDAFHGGSGGTAIHLSRDGGKTWTDPGMNSVENTFKEGQSGGLIAGIHAGVVELKDGSLLALGRSNDINGHMPMSLSKDMGMSWTYSASEFPPINGGQRLVLMRLKEGPLLLISFTDSSQLVREKKTQGIVLPGVGSVYGLFAALSFDEGKTWPVKKLLTACAVATKFDGGAWTGEFVMDAAHAEPMGYLAATQSPDGMIHLVSSALYYKFNIGWLKH